MMKTYLVIFFLIYSIDSNPFNQNDCSVCEFDEYFNQSTGYGCYPKSVNETVCTCPDHQLSIINKPCRICNRIGICGPKTAKCSEKSTSFNSTENGSHFACFCSLNLFLIGKKCPEDNSNGTTTVFMNATTTSIRTPTPSISNSTITPMKTSSPQPGTKCEDRSSSSHLFMESMLIILLNLVYFVNK